MWRTALRLPLLCLKRPTFLCHPVRPPLALPPAGQPCVRWKHSDDTPKKPALLVVCLPKPVTWLANELNQFIVRILLDREFSLREFNEGARQAILFVSSMLSQRNFDALEDLVDKKILNDLKERCSAMSDNYREALAVKSDEIMCLTPHILGISLDNDTKMFVDIRVNVWYAKDESLLGQSVKKVHQVVFGKHLVTDTQHFLLASYKFTREFSKKAEPHWIIKHISHSTVLE